MPLKRTTVRMNMRVYPDQQLFIKAEAKKKKKTEAEVIREIISDHILTKES